LSTNWHIQTNQALYDIKQDGWQKDIYNEICADNSGDTELAKSKSQANWVVNDPKFKDGKVTTHPEKYVLNIPKYKEELWKCF
jgi:hypothetical protein